MTARAWSAETARQVIQRWVIEGDLVLQTPAHFGGGDDSDFLDMPLTVDASDGRSPLLTGASIAGALRSYLLEREFGFGAEPSMDDERKSAHVRLFGGIRQDDEGEQSALIVDDAIGRATGIEFRHGVKLEHATRTAADKHLFDIQLWQAGTVFPLRFELVLCEGDEKEEVLRALATALSALAAGEIALGGRKRRGYGEVRVPAWRVRSFDLKTAVGLLEWLEAGDSPLDETYQVADIYTALGVSEPLPDKRSFAMLKARLGVPGSLLIRSVPSADSEGADVVHIRARQVHGEEQSILPGTSLAGALRARATKILQTIAPQGHVRDLIEAVFGTDMSDGAKPQASRLHICERPIEGGRANLVQFRVSIDRFTGGARHHLLFNEQPHFGDEATVVDVEMTLRSPQKHEIGLLLLLLKDLWTGDLPVGGGIGAGRGRLKGYSATLHWQYEGCQHTWHISQKGDAVVVEGGAVETLESFVDALHACVGERSAAS